MISERVRTALCGAAGIVAAALLLPASPGCGEHDEPFLEPSQEMHEAIAGSELVIIPGAGHGPQMETPGEFNRVLLGFLSRVPQTSPV